jgi:hypothetical protein
MLNNKNRNYRGIPTGDAKKNDGRDNYKKPNSPFLEIHGITEETVIKRNITEPN